MAVDFCALDESREFEAPGQSARGLREHRRLQACEDHLNLDASRNVD